jgi:hypothetical protein
MEMLLMVVAMSVLGLALSGLAFAAATRGIDAPQPPAQAPAAADRPAQRFFVDLPAGSVDVPQQIPVEALLLQIERHVRLEQAAAETFLHAPTSDSLHMSTMSPLVH